MSQYNDRSRGLFFGLRAKLISVIVAGTILGVLVFGYLKLKEDSAEFQRGLDRSGGEKAMLMAQSFAPLVLAYDYTNLESLAENMVTMEDVHKITVKNKDGKDMVVRQVNSGSKPLRTKIFSSPITYIDENLGTVDLVMSTDRIDRMLEKSYKKTATLLVILLVFISIMVYFSASFSIVNPIRRVRDLMKLIQDNPSGKIQTIDINNNDEIGDLVHIFGSMNETLFDYRNNLQDKINEAVSALQDSNNNLTARTADLENALRLVEMLATTDSLTELPNRRSFDAHMETLFNQAIRHKDPMCLILMDVDFFKQINDQNSHLAGDYVLKELGSIFRGRVRDSDLCSRLGGDEFAFLLPRTDLKGAMEMAENLLQMVVAHTFKLPPDDKIWPVTLSIGVAEMTEHTHSVESLYGLADKALYQTKKNGRNGVNGLIDIGDGDAPAH